MVSLKEKEAAFHDSAAVRHNTRTLKLKQKQNSAIVNFALHTCALYEKGLLCKATHWHVFLGKLHGAEPLFQGTLSPCLICIYMQIL